MSRAFRFVATCLVALVAACADPVDPAPPGWVPRDTVWTRDGGVRHLGGDGSAETWHHEGRTEATNQMRVTGSRAKSEGDGYECRRVVIRILDPHPLVGFAAEQVLAELSSLDDVTSVTCRAYGRSPEPGTPAPDLDVRLGLDGSVEVERRSDGFHVRATVTCESGNDGVIPELGLMKGVVRCGWMASVEHRSTTVIVRTEGASAPEFRLAGQNIGECLGKGIREQVTALIEECGEPPTPPAGMTLEYRPTPPMPWPSGVRATMVSSHSGRLVANVTNWAVEGRESLDQLLRSVSASLREKGWDPVSPFGDVSALHLRLNRGRERFVMSPDPGIAYPVTEGQPEPVVHWRAAYFLAVTPEEIGERLQDVDLTGIDPRWLLLHRDDLSPEDRRRVAAALGDELLDGWISMIWLAQLRHALADGEGAARAMTNAAVLASLAGERPALSKVWESHAESLGLLPEVPPEPGHDELVAAGAIQLETGANQERFLRAGRSLIAVAGEGDETAVTLLRLGWPRAPERGEKEPFRIHRVDAQAGMRVSTVIKMQQAGGRVPESNHIMVNLSPAAGSGPGYDVTLSLARR